MTVIWITGLSGSGKTTLSKLLIERLKLQSKSCIHIDGDEIRSVLSADAGIDNNVDRQTRVELGLRYSRLANLLSKQDHVVVVSTISLFREIHQWNRANIHGYIKIYLNQINFAVYSGGHFLVKLCRQFPQSTV